MLASRHYITNNSHYILTLLVCALGLGFASCTKDDLYRPGGPDSELRNGGDGNDRPSDDDIVDPDHPGPYTFTFHLR